MSKHWRPDDKVVPLGRPRRWRQRDWTGLDSYAPPGPRPRVPARERLPAAVGLALVAAVCIGIVAGGLQLRGPSPRFAATAEAAVIPSFGFCQWGGGTNCVVDGDTFYIAGAKVRIANIDAPETHPPRCEHEARLGDAATRKLQALLNSGRVTMTAIDRDRDIYGRLLRNVAVDGADVGEALVGAGVARDYAGGRRPWC